MCLGGYPSYLRVKFALRYAYLGGNWNNGANAGSFYWNWNNGVGNRNRNIGSRLT